jgi:DnaJ-class molecular chaperone
MERSGRSHYDVLGVSQGASGEEIRRAFRALALHCHPDVCAGPDAGRRFREISDAYDVLHDPVTRSRYDRDTTPDQRARRVPENTGGWSARRRRRDEVPRFLDEEPQEWTVVIRLEI